MNGREKPSTLRLARLTKGYRLKDVAKKVGYPVGPLSEIERGLVGVSVERLADVAGALRLTDEELGRVVREIAGSSRARKAGQPAV